MLVDENGMCTLNDEDMSYHTAAPTLHNVERIKYYQAEKTRLLACSKYLCEIFASSSSNADDLETITSILEEMTARVDTWKRLIEGQYKIGRKVQLSSLYGECVTDE